MLHVRVLQFASEFRWSYVYKKEKKKNEVIPQKSASSLASRR